MADLAAGQKLIIFAPNETESGDVKLTSSLEGFGENKRLLITAPMKGMTKHPLPVGQVVKLQCHVANAIIDFEARALQRIEKGPLSYLLMEQTSEFRRTQRRQDFRLECMQDGEIEYVDVTDNSLKRAKIVIHDISGGGASVRSPRKFYLGERVTAFLPIGDSSCAITYMSIVRRCFEVGDSVESLKYNVGLQFEFKDVKQKEDLIARIFKMEREKRKSVK
jgi:c-di-GMP-binding flagellar brake protein YcgR